MRAKVFSTGRYVLLAFGLAVMSLSACGDDDGTPVVADKATTEPSDSSPPPEESDRPAFAGATIAPGRLGTWTAGMSLEETLEASGTASMTLEESIEYNGPPTSVGESTEDMSCFYLYFGSDPEQAYESGVEGVGGAGRAMALSVGDTSVRTDAGIGVGSTLAELETAHPEVTPDPWYPQVPNRVLDAPLSDGSTGRIYFRVDDASMTVDRMTTGVSDWASLPEGCMDVPADYWVR